MIIDDAPFANRHAALVFYLISVWSRRMDAHQNRKAGELGPEMHYS
jgi:hypothetical protein